MQIVQHPINWSSILKSLLCDHVLFITEKTTWCIFIFWREFLYCQFMSAMYEFRLVGRYGHGICVEISFQLLWQKDNKGGQLLRYDV